MGRPMAILLFAVLLAGCSATRAPAAPLDDGLPLAPEGEDLPVAAPPEPPRAPPPPPARENRHAPAAPLFAPGTNGSHHVPPAYALWWALADDADGDRVTYAVRTRVEEEGAKERVACLGTILPPCTIEVPAGRRVLATVVATDGELASNASVVLHGRPPVALVPDLDGDLDVLEPLAARLRADGFHVLHAASFARLSKPADADVAAFAATNLTEAIALGLAAEGFRATQPIDVVALGQGGLAARVLAEERGVIAEGAFLDGAWNAQIGEVVLVGTPNAGAPILANNEPPEATLVVSFDGDTIPADGMRIHRVPDVRVEGADRTSVLARDELYRALMDRLAMRRG